MGGEEEEERADVSGDAKGVARATTAAAFSHHLHDTTRVLCSKSMRARCYV
jgi:hypothetical protein